jgi:FAD/FMN-containing dehydrogenase
MGVFGVRKGNGRHRGAPARIVYPNWMLAAGRTIGNTVGYVVSRRRHLSLEGRMRGSDYHNWSGDRRHRADVRYPESVAEVQEIVGSADKLRVVGAGHSFNDGLKTDGVTLSLDRLAGVIDIDRRRKQVTVWGGTRLRDLTPVLLDVGLAFQTLASHDAQSVAGILATDVHGTGRGPAHPSDAVVALDLVDGTGALHEGIGPDDDRFLAAVGGLGAVGVITKVTFQVGDAFNLKQGTITETRDWVESHFDELFAANEHVSFYAYPYTDRVHVHTWTRTEDARSRLGAFRESLNETKAAIAVAVLGDGLAHAGLLRRSASWMMRLQRPSHLVLHSHEAFSRSQYHLHQELEVAIPRDRVWNDLRELIDLFERRASEERLPFLLVEVRFTPGPHETSFLGPGVGRDTAWLCICLNQSGAVGGFFADVEEWVRRSDARVHLGKWCEDLDADDLRRMHPEGYERFRAVRQRLDPDGTFANPFVDRVLGPIG